MAENKSKKLICERCAVEFSCSAENGRCWCFDFKIETRTLLEIEKIYSNCLCVNCLREISANFDGANFTTDKI